MINIDIELVRKLREETGWGMMQCRKALEFSNGNYEGAKDYLKNFKKHNPHILYD